MYIIYMLLAWIVTRICKISHELRMNPLPRFTKLNTHKVESWLVLYNLVIAISVGVTMAADVTMHIRMNNWQQHLISLCRNRVSNEVTFEFYLCCSYYTKTNGVLLQRVRRINMVAFWFVVLAKCSCSYHTFIFGKWIATVVFVHGFKV